VWIVGAPPPDWAQNVLHLPVTQKATIDAGTPEKLWNQRNNIYQATKCPGISDPFVLMNDDFIFLTNVDPLPIIHGGPMSEHRTYRDYHDTGYKPTYDWLVDNGYPNPLYFSEHRAMLMDKTIMREAHEQVQHIRRYPVPTVYGNLAGLEGEWGEDAAHGLGRNRIWQADEVQVSTFDRDFRLEPYGQLLRYIHSDPSPYERI
jgi:hypothetical protein